MTDKTLATFRIDAKQWQAFKAKAAEADTNATALLLQWVALYLDNNLDFGLDTIETHLDKNLDNVLSSLDERIDSAIAPLQQQIDQLKAELGEFAA
jgi:hypothetical protein